MRKIGLLGAIAVLLASLATPPAHAGQQFTIKASQFIDGNGVVPAVIRACDLSKKDTVNGIDGWILPVSWAPGTVVTVAYGGAGITPQSFVQSHFYTASCGEVVSAEQRPGIAGASHTTRVPGGVAWMLINAVKTADITVTVTP